ncbi:MAG: class I SAM-dependent methyltransferase [Mycobacterium leprae]
MDATKARLARGYSQTAPFWDAMVGQQYLMGLYRLMPQVSLPPQPAILDIGCGTGINLFEARRWFGPARLLCGIDLSPGMIEVARAKARKMGLPAQFVVGDAESLPYPDQVFDLIICNSVYHWFKDKDRALAEMHRVLRPGGKLLLICAAAPGFKDYYNLLDTVLVRLFGSNGGRTMPELPTVEGIRRAMQRNGFLVPYAGNPMQMQRIYQPESFVRMMSTVAPHWGADLPEDVRAFVEQAAASFMRTGWPDGFPNLWSTAEAIAIRRA